MAEAEALLVDTHMAVGPTPSAREVMAEAEPWLVDIHMAVGPTPSFPAEVVAVVALPLADGVSQVVPAPLLRWLQWWPPLIADDAKEMVGPAACSSHPTFG